MTIVSAITMVGLLSFSFHLVLFSSPFILSPRIFSLPHLLPSPSISLPSISLLFILFSLPHLLPFRSRTITLYPLSSIYPGNRNHLRRNPRHSLL
ncbi:uncharacterized protein C8R40DRAFT_1086355 [Lentinula edodes]|uniref:uncharacterized protein n=1 Tax=Lentinula edodes TaxID=5353 RepID=UPI001E8CEAB0|nr:uncharacterized protein C8R40DRAFT_1086355 [Lentinula edodes]KAH7879374.1 hypothetical protein C8R40DRAFT_1086355 [Lentinula edodes]